MSNLILVLLAFCNLLPFLSKAEHPVSHGDQKPAVVWDHGAIVRGDVSRKQIALVFTGGDYGEGTAPNWTAFTGKE